jgi:muramidase (phage lysozyme)
MKQAKRIAKYVSFCLGLGMIALIASTQVSITYASQLLPAQKLQGYLGNPRVQAFLDTIAYSEGTLNKDGYNTLFGHGYFKNFKDHPRQVICKKYNGTLLCSSAAGRYQFLQKTWDKISPQIEARNFSPYYQDLGAVALLSQHSVLDNLTRIQNKKDFSRSIYRVNKTWAGLPGAPYGQPTKSMAELEAVYRQQLKHHQENPEELIQRYNGKKRKAA